MKTLTRAKMMSDENNFCIVSLNDKDDILFIGTEEECDSKFNSIIEDKDNNDLAECYTICNYEFYENL